eukprot:CAMPEP_0198125778 /NCGR_PEP_ID=MMETSP1442-20131203/43370_1 /TAXON_ID= /ORGANISM="Craspedostauros australis, Strain CCMP3328" /LENGTH=56 /DNA_ID=CAMNT_0043785443 /DNA_START=277 /DNA_END=447 /DNA_ORIENTATION=+
MIMLRAAGSVIFVALDRPARNNVPSSISGVRRRDSGGWSASSRTPRSLKPGDAAGM